MKRYDTDALERALQALNNAPPPEEEEGYAARQMVEKMYDRIGELLEQGHNYSTVASILAEVDIHISSATLGQYYREETERRRLEKARLRRQARKNSATVDSPTGKTPMPAKPSVDVLSATLEGDADDDYDEIQ